MLRHQASTWELLHVLFSAIDGEKPVGQGWDGGGDGGRRAGQDDAMQGGEEELQLDRLAAFKRRAQLRCAGQGHGPGSLPVCWRADVRGCGALLHLFLPVTGRQGLPARWAGCWSRACSP